MKDYYRILGVPDNANDQDIKVAYRRLAKRYHPDVNAGDKRSEERFKEILEAYNTLSDPILRRTYDNRRLRNDLYSASANYSSFYYAQPKPEKKDPRRKEYSEADLRRARERHQHRVSRQMKRRKKLLVGMIVTFIVYISASMFFESWIEEKRKKESEQMDQMMSQLSKEDQLRQKTSIQDLDSPYDAVFNTLEEGWESNNDLFIKNPYSEAIICAVQSTPPYHTVRNEYLGPRESFIMRRLPKGSYYIKVYTGEGWDFTKAIPGGKKLGGFRKDEEFFQLESGPYVLNKAPSQYKLRVPLDTIVIDPTVLPFKRISREEFFNPGQ